eukprot:2690744-Pleurochrysis_carterae.AAC.2
MVRRCRRESASPRGTACTARTCVIAWERWLRRRRRSRRDAQRRARSEHQTSAKVGASIGTLRCASADAHRWSRHGAT